MLLPYALNEFALENDWVRQKLDTSREPAQQRTTGNYELVGKNHLLDTVFEKFAERSSIQR